MIRAPVRSRMANGPLPTGCRAKVGAGAAASTDSCGTTPNTGLLSTDGRTAKGWSRETWTTSTDGAVTPARLGVPSLRAVSEYPVTGSSNSAPGEPDPRRAMRSSVYFTSVAVIARPLENWAPGRRKKSHCF